MAKPSVVALSVALSVLLGGCAQADPAGQPTYSCTPEAGGTPYPCYRVQHDEVGKREALYAEAEAVYRKYLAEDERISRLGGVGEPTPVMQETMTSAALAEALETYRGFKKDKMRVEGGAMRVAWVRRQPDKLTSGMVVALSTCIDASSAHLVQPGSRDTPLGFIAGSVQLARESGALKVALVDGNEAASC
jgi:hypothetical protein